MVLGEVCGFFIRSNRVETDSTLGLRRSSGLESKRTKAISASDTTPATAAMRSTVRRLRGHEIVQPAPGMRKPTSSSSPGGLQQHQQGGQQGDGEQEGHDHADAGDLAQFGDAGIGGGQEGEEAGRGGGGGQRQRHADAAPGAASALARSSLLDSARCDSAPRTGCRNPPPGRQTAR